MIQNERHSPRARVTGAVIRPKCTSRFRLVSWTDSTVPHLIDVSLTSVKALAMNAAMGRYPTGAFSVHERVVTKILRGNTFRLYDSWLAVEDASN